MVESAPLPGDREPLQAALIASLDATMDRIREMQSLNPPQWSEGPAFGEAWAKQFFQETFTSYWAKVNDCLKLCQGIPYTLEDPNTGKSQSGRLVSLNGYNALIDSWDFLFVSPAFPKGRSVPITNDALLQTLDIQ